MTTARDICIMALKDAQVLGVGQTPLQMDINDAFTKLNWMLAQWAVKRWLVYRLETFSVTSTGAQSYTIGPGGNINVTVRPDRIESAFLRQITNPANLPDYPLEIIEARETYNRLTLKSIVSFSSYLFYDNAFPMGVLYPWPVMQATNYALFVSIKNQLRSFANLSDTVILPPEYEGAIESNLAVWLAGIYGNEPLQGVQALAKAGLNTVRGANTQIARLTMPGELQRPSSYNIYSDQYR